MKDVAKNILINLARGINKEWEEEMKSKKKVLMDLALENKDYGWAKYIQENYGVLVSGEVENIEYNYNHPTETLAEIWNKLNEWEWDIRLGKTPKNYEILPYWCQDKSILTKNKINKPIMKTIKNIIGEKECLRWHQINNRKKTNEQFEIWWKEYGA